MKIQIKIDKNMTDEEILKQVKYNHQLTVNNTDKAKTDDKIKKIYLAYVSHLDFSKDDAVKFKELEFSTTKKSYIFENNIYLNCSDSKKRFSKIELDELFKDSDVFVNKYYLNSHYSNTVFDLFTLTDDKDVVLKHLRDNYKYAVRKTYKSNLNRMNELETRNKELESFLGIRNDR